MKKLITKGLMIALLTLGSTSSFASTPVGASYFSVVTSITPQANDSGVRIIGLDLNGKALEVDLMTNTTMLNRCFGLANTALLAGLSSGSVRLQIIGNGLNFGASNQYDTSNGKFFCELDRTH